MRWWIEPLCMCGFLVGFLLLLYAAAATSPAAAAIGLVVMTGSLIAADYFEEAEPY